MDIDVITGDIALEMMALVNGLGDGRKFNGVPSLIPSETSVFLDHDDAFDCYVCVVFMLFLLLFQSVVAVVVLCRWCLMVAVRFVVADIDVEIAW